MTSQFVDTSGWANWAVRSEPYYELAGLCVAEVWDAGGTLVTTNWVLDELTGLLTSPLRMDKRTQVGVLDGIRSDPSVRVVAIDAALEADAWQLWRTRLDKDWSLTDCASFVVMTRLRLADALTADHHFEQAGFVRLLK